MAKNVDEFEQKIKDILEGKLPSLIEEGYKVAQERDIKRIGLQLKEVYETVLKQASLPKKKKHRHKKEEVK